MTLLPEHDADETPSHALLRWPDDPADQASFMGAIRHEAAEAPELLEARISATESTLQRTAWRLAGLDLLSRASGNTTLLAAALSTAQSLKLGAYTARAHLAWLCPDRRVAHQSPNARSGNLQPSQWDALAAITPVGAALDQAMLSKHTETQREKANVRIRAALLALLTDGPLALPKEGEYRSAVQSVLELLARHDPEGLAQKLSSTRQAMDGADIGSRREALRRGIDCLSACLSAAGHSPTEDDQPVTPAPQRLPMGAFKLGPRTPVRALFSHDHRIVTIGPKSGGYTPASLGLPLRILLDRGGASLELLHPDKGLLKRRLLGLDLEALERHENDHIAMDNGPSWLLSNAGAPAFGRWYVPVDRAGSTLVRNTMMDAAPIGA